MLNFGKSVNKILIPDLSEQTVLQSVIKAGQNYLDRLGSYHCELMSGDLLKTLTN